MLDQKKYFDEHYRNTKPVDYRDSKYFHLWSMIITVLKLNNIKSVLEAGCGDGQFGRMVLNNGINYRGFDFSKEGLKHCKLLNVFLGDVTDKSSYEGTEEAIVCTEVLEHIEDDIDIIKKMPEEKLIIISVPDFKHKAHIRRFKSKKEVFKRYGKFFSYFRIAKIRRQYLFWGYK